MASKQAGAEPGVLVTRPAGLAADALCAALAAAGYCAHHLALLELHAIARLSPGQHQLVQDLDRYQHVIFISGNAVRYGMAQVANCWPQLPVGLNWYAIGEATAAQLAEYGPVALTPGTRMSSEGLLALPGLQQLAHERVLIIKGEGGRDTLAQELRQRGASVDELACYIRKPVSLPSGEMAEKLNHWQIGAVLISSGAGLANLQVLLSPAETSNFKHLRIIVPSERVARLARDAGFNHIVTAENASDAAMIRALQVSKSSSGD